MDIKKIGATCREFRIEVLELSLTMFAEISNENLKNINAFEFGRANNIKYIYLYTNLATDEQVELLLSKLFNR